MYEGRDPLGQPVAIKVLHSQHPQGDSRFRREIKVMRGLPRSNHIVEFFDEGEMVDGTPFISMEFIRGFTLGKLLRSGRRLSEQAACVLMMELCEAFEPLHKLGLTHGDIKPNNIMLSKDPNARNRPARGTKDVIHLGQVERSGLHLKLLDFGLVRDSQGLLKLMEQENMVDGNEFREDLDTGMLGGTPEYISPEQIHDARQTKQKDCLTDTPSDVFGLGVIFYELLSGQTPWPFRPTARNAEEYKDQTKEYLDSRMNAVPDKLAGTSAALWSVIARALDPEPKKRQGTAKEMGQDIRRYVDFGAGIPENTDNENTVMAYLEDLTPEKPQRDTLSALFEQSISRPGVPKRPETTDEVSQVGRRPMPTAPVMWIAAGAAVLVAVAFFVLQM